MSEPSPDRRLLAVLCADLVGYSRLMRADEEGTLAEWQAHMNQLVRPAVARHRGRLVKTTGDGFFATFESPVEAVRCAADIQDGMGSRTAGVAPEQRQQFRIGINLGDAILAEDDIFGDAVNLAARLQTLAEPGTVFLSATVHEHVRDHLDRPCVDLGEQHVKNIDRPIRVFRLGGPAQRRRRWWPYAAGVAAMLLLCVGGALWWWRAAPPAQAPVIAEAGRRPSIAVLPFANQSDDPGQAYFSDGITEDLIAALGRFPTLTVMSRNAVTPYQGRNAAPAEIARELGVRYLVEGSVRRAGERVRVSAHLTDTAAGKLLWSQQYDEPLKEVFAVQDAVTRQVAGALAVKLTGIEQQRALAKPTENLDAYDLVLRARERKLLSTRAANREARRLLERATQLDPRYAAAYAWLGLAYWDVVNLGWTEDPDEAVDRALDFGQRALALDPDNMEAHRLISFIHLHRSQYDQALAEIDDVLTRNPSDAASLRGRASVLLYLGRIDDAIEDSEAAFRFDPNPSPGAILDLGMAYYQARREVDALRVLERGAVRFPNYPFTYAVLAASYAQIGRMPEAAKARETVQRLNPFFDSAIFGSRFQNQAHHAYLVEGLAKAGLK